MYNKYVTIYHAASGSKLYTAKGTLLTRRHTPIKQPSAHARTMHNVSSAAVILTATRNEHWEAA